MSVKNRTIDNFVNAADEMDAHLDRCEDVHQLVCEEITNNYDRWGIQDLPDGTMTQLGFIAEQEKHKNEHLQKHGKLTWFDVLSEEFHEASAETDPEKLVAELVQVAAVAIAWAERVRSRNGSHKG